MRLVAASDSSVRSRNVVIAIIPPPATRATGLDSLRAHCDAVDDTILATISESISDKLRAT